MRRLLWSDHPTVKLRVSGSCPRGHALGRTTHQGHLKNVKENNKQAKKRKTRKVEGGGRGRGNECGRGEDFLNPWKTKTLPCKSRRDACGEAKRWTGQRVQAGASVKKVRRSAGRSSGRERPRRAFYTEVAAPVSTLSRRARAPAAQLPAYGAGPGCSKGPPSFWGGGGRASHSTGRPGGTEGPGRGTPRASGET